MLVIKQFVIVATLFFPIDDPFSDQVFGDGNTHPETYSEMTCKNEVVPQIVEAFDEQGVTVVSIKCIDMKDWI